MVGPNPVELANPSFHDPKLKAKPAKLVDLSWQDVRAELMKAMPDLEKRIGPGGVASLSRSFSELANCAKGISPEFFGRVFKANKIFVDGVYKELLGQYDIPASSRVHVFTTVLATVASGSIVGVDPLHVLVLIKREQRKKFDPNARNINSNGTTDIGVYQINSRWVNNPLSPSDVNSAVAALGGHQLKHIPKFWTTDIVLNSFGAALVLANKMSELGTTSDWQRIYAAYNGRGPKADEYGKEIKAEYDKWNASHKFRLLATK